MNSGASKSCPEQLPNLMHCIRFRLQKSRGVKGQGLGLSRMAQRSVERVARYTRYFKASTGPGLDHVSWAITALHGHRLRLRYLPAPRLERHRESH